MEKRFKKSIAKADSKRRKEYESLINRFDIMKKKIAVQFKELESITPEIELFLKNYFAAHPLTVEQNDSFTDKVKVEYQKNGRMEPTLFNYIMLLQTSIGTFEKVKTGVQKIDNKCDELKKEFPNNHVPILAIDNLIETLKQDEETYLFVLRIVPVLKETSVDEMAFIKEHYNDVFVKYSTPELLN